VISREKGKRNAFGALWQVFSCIIKATFSIINPSIK